MNQRRPLRGLFKGGTPQGILQTVDVGAGRPEWVLRQAVRFPERRYAVADPVFAEDDVAQRSERTFHYNAAELRPQLEERNVLVLPLKLGPLIAHMQQHGLRTRHFNIDFPLTGWGGDAYGDLEMTYPELSALFKNAHTLLVPGGRIFITTRSSKVPFLSSLVQQEGLRVKVKEVPQMPVERLRSPELRREAEREGRQWGRAEQSPPSTRSLRTLVITPPRKRYRSGQSEPER